jgi:hypothetical protein
MSKSLPGLHRVVQRTTALLLYLLQNSRDSILITSRNGGAAFRLAGREGCIVNVEKMDVDQIRSL